MSLQALEMGAVARFEVLERSRLRLEQIETGIGGRAAQGLAVKLWPCQRVSWGPVR